MRCADQRPLLPDALHAAFKKCRKPRPVGTGPGAEERRSIAIVVIGGQTLSLLLTLLATPVFYTLFEDAAASARWRAFAARLEPAIASLSAALRRLLSPRAAG